MCFETLYKLQVSFNIAQLSELFQPASHLQQGSETAVGSALSTQKAPRAFAPSLRDLFCLWVAC